MKKLGFGFMRLPLLDENDHSSIDIEKTKVLVDEYMKRGFNYFDTGYGYHGEKSENAIYEAVVSRYPREDIIIADKMPTIRVKSADDYPILFENQLKRCGVDHFDYYLLHNIWERSYRDTVNFGGFDFIKRKIEEGHIRRFGFSFHDRPELLDEVLTDHPEVEFVQLQLNYIDWDSPVVCARQCAQVCKKHNKPIIVMEPNKAGSLIDLPPQAEKILRAYAPDRPNVSWSMRFAASQENVFLVLSGMNELEQVIQNTEIMDAPQPLSSEEYKIIGQVCEIIAQSVAIPCTKCRYCAEKCPLGIPIPEYFAAFNSYFMTKNMGNAGMYYRRYANNAPLASQCLKCRQCVPSCPQHLDIPTLLSEAADLFEK